MAGLKLRVLQNSQEDNLTETVLLILTLFVSGLTFGGGRTNVLQGVVHLPLFAIYVMLISAPER